MVLKYKLKRTRKPRKTRNTRNTRKTRNTKSKRRVKGGSFGMPGPSLTLPGGYTIGTKKYRKCDYFGVWSGEEKGKCKDCYSINGMPEKCTLSESNSWF